MGVGGRGRTRRCFALLHRVRVKMAFLGFRAYPTPIMKPLWPFFAASGLVYYAVSKIQYAGVRSGEYAKDPKNPYGMYTV